MFVENFIQSFVLTINASPFGNLVATSSLWDILVGFLSFYFFIFLILYWIRVSSGVDFLELKKNVAPLLKDFKSVKDLFFIYYLVTFYVPCFVVRKLDILGPIFFCFCVCFWFSNVNFFDNQIIILCFVYLSTLAGAFSFHYALRDIEIIIDFLSSLFGKDPVSLKTFLVYIFYSSEEEQNPFKVLLVVTYISSFFSTILFTVLSPVFAYLDFLVIVEIIQRMNHISIECLGEPCLTLEEIWQIVHYFFEK